jgi:hypothetical protein
MSVTNGATCRVKLVFADRGVFHSVWVAVPAASLKDYDRLVDLLREEPSVTRQLYVDLRRLVTAAVEEDEVAR